MSAPPGSGDPRAWDAYIAAAPSFAEAGARIEQAVGASVDFAELRRLQGARS